MRARAQGCAWKCESGSVSAHGGGRELNRARRGGIYAGRQTIMSKLRRYERTAKGTGKRINGIGVQQAAGDAMKRNQLFSQNEWQCDTPECHRKHLHRDMRYVYLSGFQNMHS